MYIIDIEYVALAKSKLFIASYLKVPLDDFGPWEESGHAPEAEFLEKLKSIDGVSQVETQTITNMEI